MEKELRPLSDQYNEFARPAQMWDLCLVGRCRLTPSNPP